MKVDYLIVGQGIAGTLLAQQLLKEGKTFVVADHPDIPSASSVSAGICNPVVFRKITTSWMIRQLLPKAIETYSELEKLLDQPLITWRETLKVFTSDTEKKQWEKKAYDPEMMEYLSPETVQLPANLYNAPLAAGKVLKGMQINMNILLPRFRSYLDSRKLFHPASINYSDITVNEEEIKWQGVTAKRLVFCEGYNVLQNPWFSWLPLKPVKGEVLIIKTNLPDPGYLINRKLIFFPMGDGLFWAGSTYNWKQLDEITTEEGKAEIMEKLDQLLHIPYEVITHKAGVRPAVRDRRPLIGQHPVHKNLFVFNGLGTKGTMIAPYFAEELINMIEKGSKLNEEADVKRFYRFYEEQATAT